MMGGKNHRKRKNYGGLDVNERVGRNSNPNSKGSTSKNYKKDERKKGEKKEVVNKDYIKPIVVKIISQSLSALSNDTRLKIARFIQKNKKATFEDLRIAFNLNNNTLMFHLQKLQEANIVYQPQERGAYQMGKLGDTMLSFVDELESEILLVSEKY